MNAPISMRWRVPMILYCNPTCGHALTVTLRLDARGIPHVVRPLESFTSSPELVERCGLQSSPVLVAGQVVVVGAGRILRFLDTLPDESEL